MSKSLYQSILGEILVSMVCTSGSLYILCLIFVPSIKIVSTLDNSFLNVLCISGTVDKLLVIVFASFNTVSTLDQNDVYLRYS